MLKFTLSDVRLSDVKTIETRLDLYKDNVKQYTKTLNYSVGDFETIDELKQKIIEDVDLLLRNTMIHMFKKARTESNINRLDDLIGRSRELSNTIVVFNDKRYQIDEDGNMTEV